MFNKISNNANESKPNNNENCVKMIDLDSSTVLQEAVKYIDKNFACKHCIFPFYIKDNNLSVAMSDVSDRNVLKDLKFVSKKDIIPYMATKKQILAYIKSYYDIEDRERAIEELTLEAVSGNKRLNKILDEKESLSSAPSVRIMDSIINQALDKNASDVHIEPFRTHVVVRLRIDGVLKQVMELPLNIYNNICIRIKVMARMDITNKMLPQDGKIDYEKNSTNYDFRVSSMPTIYGEKIVIRILYKSTENICIDKIAMKCSEDIKGIIKHNNGIILVTGPTGSGKSTTLCAILKELNNSEKNIVTLEDPVEFTLENTNQITINEKSGLTFASGLRSILRQDPDIIMVGEIRDEETAKVAVRAAITGHLVISTLHTNDSITTILRLIDMGVQPYLVADALIAVVAQRLVRKICPHCRTSYKPSSYESEVIGISDCNRLYRGKGCSKCNETGYLGRIAVFEIMKIDETNRSYICGGKSAAEIRKYNLDKGMISLKNSTLELVKEGITTFDEFIKIVDCDW